MIIGNRVWVLCLGWRVVVELVWCARCGRGRGSFTEYICFLERCWVEGGCSLSLSSGIGAFLYTSNPLLLFAHSDSVLLHETRHGFEAHVGGGISMRQFRMQVGCVAAAARPSVWTACVHADLRAESVDLGEFPDLICRSLTRCVITSYSNKIWAKAFENRRAELVVPAVQVIRQRANRARGRRQQVSMRCRYKLPHYAGVGRRRRLAVCRKRVHQMQAAYKPPQLHPVGRAPAGCASRSIYS
jgi:hypothetical protein